MVEKTLLPDKRQGLKALRSEASALLEASRSRRKVFNDTNNNNNEAKAKKKSCCRLFLCCRSKTTETREIFSFQVDETGPPLSASVTDRASFLQLRLFARAKGVTQADLIKLFEKYEDHYVGRVHPDGSVKAPNKMSMLLFQDFFDRTSTEAVSLVLIPLLFVKDNFGLAPPETSTEIDFVRFVCAGYAFGQASPAGLIVYFFRLLLDYAMCSAKALVPLKPFEDLVGLLHGGLSRPLLALMREVFEDATFLRFGDLVRACLSAPLLLLPLFQFQRSFRSKFFGKTFWHIHAAPCFDPLEAPLFDDLAIHPKYESAIADIDTTESSWRLTARRLVARVLKQAEAPPSAELLLGETPQQDASSSPLAAHQKQQQQQKGPRSSEKKKKNCWRNLRLRGDDTLLTPEDLDRARTVLRDRYGDRVASFFLCLAQDRPLALSAIKDALATDPSLVLQQETHHDLSFQVIDDPKSRRPFYHNAATGLSFWHHPNNLDDGLAPQQSTPRQEGTIIHKAPSADGQDQSSTTGSDDSSNDKKCDHLPTGITRGERRRRKIKWRNRRRHSAERKK